MTIRRRYFRVPSGTTEIIVTHDDASHEFYLGWRVEPWEAFSTPVEADRVEDDTPISELGPDAVDRHAPGDREYPAE